MSGPWPEIAGYDVQAEIGRGGMGVVYRVRRHSTGATLALKMMVQGRGASFAELARFRVEAEALACLNHPNIIKIRGVGFHAGFPYFAMDFAERGSLRQEIAQGPRSPAVAGDLARTLALAMQHAHERGMLHRDLKPANILLMDDGTPKISDFGLVKFADPINEVSNAYRTFSVNLLDTELSRMARELDSLYHTVADAPAAVNEEALTQSFWNTCAARTGMLVDSTRLEAVRAFLTEARQHQEVPGSELVLDNLTRSGAVMGSPNYMAPEQALGALDRIGPATDVYALGGILYELLTGETPFRGASLLDLMVQAASTPPRPPRELVAEVPADLEAICLRCLEKRPDDRYPTAGELADDLERALRGEAVQAPFRPARVVPPDQPDALGNATTTISPGATATVQGNTNTSTTRSWWPFRSRKSRAGEVRSGEETARFPS